jgi:cytochrome c
MLYRRQKPSIGRPAMSRRPALSALAPAVLAAAALAHAVPARAQMVAPKPAPPSGERLFGQRCGACHATAPGETRVGPSLAGVVGRKAGSVPGYAYSAALKASGLVWTKANLDRWLTGSNALVPGTKMAYAQADAAGRAAIIDYLATLSKK